jgi:hypothetical protein
VNKLILSALAFCLILNTFATTPSEELNDYKWSNASNVSQSGDSAMTASWTTYMNTLDVHQQDAKNDHEDFLGNLPKIVKSISSQINASSCQTYLNRLSETNDLGKVKMICNSTLNYIKEFTDEIFADIKTITNSAEENKVSKGSLRKYLNNNAYYC